jgi:hypothetical protein
MSAYQGMTNPEAVAAIARLEGKDREKALADLGERREAVEEALASQPEVDGARAAVLERLGREKQINDSQAWTADGISPNSPLVTEAAAAKFTEAQDGEAVIGQLTEETAAKSEGDMLAASGRDTGQSLSSEEAAKGQEEAKRLAGHLPSDFPHLAHLEAGDAGTFAKLRGHIDAGTLTGIENIGDARAKEIEKAYKKLEKA